jgi:hypothetical protein
MVGYNFDNTSRKELYNKAINNSDEYKRYATTKNLFCELENEHHHIMIDGSLRDLNGFDYMAWEDLENEVKQKSIHH